VEIRMQGNERNETDVSVYEENWKDTWTSFNRALRSTNEFNAFVWVFRLSKAALGYAYFKSGLYRLQIHRVWRSCVPAFAVMLICGVVSSYFFSLRSTIIVRRWCCADTTNSDRETCEENCRWLFLHDIAVSYIGFMIVFNFLSGCFRSPGVALAAEYNDCEEEDGKIADELRWNAMDSKGGCCCISPVLNIKAERRRVSQYSKLEISTAPQEELFPTKDPSFCNKCNISRPPRCHHCSFCKRCILQFDHHCVWLNNCVGYNNYRAFILTLFFLTIGCWYGVSIMFFPFYEPLKKQVAEHGYRFLYDNKTGFLDIPPPWILMYQMFSSRLDPEVVIKLVFPLLAIVGLLQTVFLGYHVHYVLLARTTLEYKIMLGRQYQHLVERKEQYKAPPNPFDNGWYANLRLALGPGILIFLPIPVEPNLAIEGKIKKTN
jgi:hypothetical protein